MTARHVSARWMGELALAVGFLLAGCSAAPPRLESAEVRRTCLERVAEDHLVGLSVAIVRDGRIEQQHGFGVASLATQAPVGIETTFAIGSVTKQFVAAAVLLLMDDGKLALDDKVAKWEPGLTRAGDITLRDLLQHVSGYPDYYPLDFVDARLAAATTPAQVVREYASRPLDFEPGTEWSYSNTGFLLLGTVVERVSGQPLGEFLSHRIFGPLGLEHTRLDPPHGAAGQATGYASFATGEFTAAPPEAAGWLAGAGGIWSTAGDLALWDLALMDGRILSERARAAMFEPRRLADGSSTQYGLGVGVTQTKGRTVIQHTGAVSGFAAYNAMVPDERAAVVILSNCEDSMDGGLLLDRVAPPRDEKAAAKSAPSTPPNRRRAAPAVAGPPALAAALDLFQQLQRGVVDRARLSRDFTAFLTDERAKAAAAALAPLGAPTAAEVTKLSERGGMEVARVTLRFAKATRRALMYRSPDGVVQEFFVSR